MIGAAADEALARRCDAPAGVEAKESARLHALRRYAILDSPPDAIFDRITAMAARLLATPIALISLVDQRAAVVQVVPWRGAARNVPGRLHVRSRGARRRGAGDSGCARGSALCRQPAGHGTAAHPLLRGRAADHRGRSQHRRPVRHRPHAKKPVRRAKAPAARSRPHRGRADSAALVQSGSAQRDRRARAHRAGAARERAALPRFRRDHLRLVLGDGRRAALFLVLGPLPAPDRGRREHAPGQAPRRGRVARPRRRRLGWPSRRPGGAAPVSGLRLRVQGS